MKSFPSTIGSSLSFFASLALIVSSSRADVITQTTNLPSQLLAGPITGFTLSPAPEVTLGLAFDQFDTSLGTLDSVDWEYSFDFEVTATLGAGGGSISGSTGGNFYLDPLKDAGEGPFFGAGGGNGNGGGPGPISATFTVTSMQSYDGTVIGANYDFFSAPGGGTHQIDWVLDSTFLDASDNASDARLTLLGGSSTLDFNFTPGAAAAVPEPSTTAFCGLCCLGFAAYRRRKRKIATPATAP